MKTSIITSCLIALQISFTLHSYASSCLTVNGKPGPCPNAQYKGDIKSKSGLHSIDIWLKALSLLNQQIDINFTQKENKLLVKVTDKKSGKIIYEETFLKQKENKYISKNISERYDDNLVKKYIDKQSVENTENILKTLFNDPTFNFMATKQ